MKKSFYRISVFFLVLFLAFSSFPFHTVKAATITENFVDFLRTNLGMVKISNGSLSNIDRYDFYVSLYNTPLVWTYNGQDFNFVPSSYFNSLESWITVCNPNNQSGSFDPQFVDFDIKECLIKSGYIRDTGTGYDLSDFPKLSNISDTVSPLDGIVVKTNFSDYDNYSSFTIRPSYNNTFINSLKSDFISNYGNVILISGRTNASNTNVFRTLFLSVNSSSDYFFIIPVSQNNNTFVYYQTVFHNNNSWTNPSDGYMFNGLTSSVSMTNKNSYGYIDSSYRVSFLNYITNPSFIDSSSTNLISTGSNPSFFSYDSSKPPLFWSNYPIVFASSNQVGQNYYYWLRGVPDGSFYSTANTNTIYNYDYVTNNNWETAYNNYITDVSNYYNTTENITNEQISNFIDNSTTINNITNNYITNNSGGDGGDGGGSFDDSVIRNWLEMIYEKLQDIESNTYGLDDFLEIISNQLNTIKEKLTDIFYWIAGRSTDPAEPHYTEDSITNDILKFPEENLFPDVPDENFISPEDIEGLDAIPWELISAKIGAVISEVVPFCYLFTLSSFMELLVAPPSAPYYEIPFVIERLNINENVIIDLTGESWQVLHGVWIALFMIMFVVFLFYLTHKVLLLISNMFV